MNRKKKKTLKCSVLVGLIVIKQTRLFCMRFKVFGQLLASLVNLTAGLVVFEAVVEHEPRVFDDLRVVGVFEVVYVVFDCGEIHWCLDNFKVVGRVASRHGLQKRPAVGILHQIVEQRLDHLAAMCHLGVSRACIIHAKFVDYKNMNEIKFHEVITMTRQTSFNTFIFGSFSIFTEVVISFSQILITDLIVDRFFAP